MDAEKTSGLTFGEVVKYMKKGLEDNYPVRACRAGWHGKGMWIVLMGGLVLPPNSSEEIPRVNDRTALYIGKDTPLDSQPYFALRNAQGQWQPGWTVSNPDALAEDWMILTGSPTEERILLEVPQPPEEKMLNALNYVLSAAPKEVSALMETRIEVDEERLVKAFPFPFPLGDMNTGKLAVSPQLLLQAVLYVIAARPLVLVAHYADDKTTLLRFSLRAQEGAHSG